VGEIREVKRGEEEKTRERKKIFGGRRGAKRATTWYRVPREGKTNNNIETGRDGNQDDIVRNTEKGIILDGDKSWSIGSNREQFHFATDFG